MLMELTLKSVRVLPEFRAEITLKSVRDGLILLEIRKSICQVKN